jgi:putative addiction module CopG family antidote
MSVELGSETEKRIADAVRSGRFASVREVVEAAVRHLLDEPAPAEGKFHALRRCIEESGVPLLSDDELRREIRERRGLWA